MTSRQKKIKKLCQKFYDDMQKIFDEMSDAVGTADDGEYECQACQVAVSAQNYAYDVIEAETEDWK